jgi:choline dehydrogenase-like flavoprotein
VLVDGRSLADGARLEGDVCVVGAGPAGLAVALGLEETGAKVVALAGPEDELAGEVVGDAYPPLAETRAGGIGGTAALWSAEVAPRTMGVRYAPLSPIDFEARSAVPGSGWPFGRDTLDPFYARAHEFCEAGPFDYEVDDPEASSAAGLEGDGLANRVFRFGLSETFTQTHRDGVTRSESVRVVTAASVTRIHRVDDGSAVEDVEASSAPGRSFRVRARAYVLAAGGIENARLLLLSGIGDDDLVGCCFMDHPTIRCRLELDAANRTKLGFYDTRTLEDRLVLGALELPEERLRDEGLLNGAFFVVPARDRELRAAAAAKSLAEAARKRQVPPEPLRRAVEALAGVDVLSFAAHRRLVQALPTLEPTIRLWRRSRLLDTLGVGPVSGWSRRRGRPRAYDVHHVVEQAPDPERRVTLGSARDRFGLPVARLRWSVGARELESAERTQELVREELLRRGLGLLRTGRELAPGGDLAAAVHPSVHHHLGTTRMHRDPRHGVVDADTRVHGVANLFVAGGSVFPTSGFVNPTLTIVALALRLVANLRQDM